MFLENIQIRPYERSKLSIKNEGLSECPEVVETKIRKRNRSTAKDNHQFTQQDDRVQFSQAEEISGEVVQLRSGLFREIHERDAEVRQDVRHAYSVSHKHRQ